MVLTSLISIKNISKTFSSGTSAVQALKNISLQTESSELLLIMGPSGCGKTTLLSLISGTLSFETGDISVFGHSLKEMSDKELAQFRSKNIGFVFQHFNLIPTLSCLENVMIPLLIQGIEEKIASEKAAKTLEQVGLKNKSAYRPSILSGGEQQRVAIARAIVHKPRLLICDEPTSALDAQTGAKIMHLLRSIRIEMQHLIIVVSHDQRVMKYADRIVEMDDGSLLKINILKPELNSDSDGSKE